MNTPKHYQPTGTGPTPWDLEKTMQSSGNAFVDARRTDAIEYAFRMKGDLKVLADDLRKAAHGLIEAANFLERGTVEETEFKMFCAQCKPPTGFKYSGKAAVDGVCSECSRYPVYVQEWIRTSITEIKV